MLVVEVYCNARSYVSQEMSFFEVLGEVVGRLELRIQSMETWKQAAPPKACDAIGVLEQAADRAFDAVEAAVLRTPDPALHIRISQDESKVLTSPTLSISSRHVVQSELIVEPCSVGRSRCMDGRMD